MSDDEIIAILIKGRERFRQLVQVYQRERQAVPPRSEANPSPNVRVLKEAERILATALSHLQLLPEKPSQACASQESRLYADQLLKEIGDLLESAMILEKEMRKTPLVQSSGGPGNSIREKALRSYTAC